jgi:hypothetical protein
MFGGNKMLKPIEIIQTLHEARDYFINNIGDTPYIVSLQALRNLQNNTPTQEFINELESILSSYYINCGWNIPQNFLGSINFQLIFHRILPFILRWQVLRFCDKNFIRIYAGEFLRFIQDYSDKLKQFCEWVNFYKLFSLSFFDLNYYNYETYFISLRNYLGNEPVSIAKILHILSPKTFIPWDNQIISWFNIQRDSKGFAYFNFLIKSWILKNPYVMQLEDENYSILRILDMAFYLLANNKIPPLSSLGERIIELIKQIKII